MSEPSEPIEQLDAPVAAEIIAPAKGHDPYAALRIWEFRWYLCGWVLSVIGQQLQSMAVGWEITQRTHRPLPLGLVGLVQAAPLIVLALPAGQLADWASRKVILASTQVGAMLCSLLLALITWRHGATWSIYAVLGVGATFTALGWSARAALLPQIVPAEHFANAVAWYSSLFQVAAVAGPAIGGLVIQQSTWPAFLIDSACAALFGAAVILIPLKIAAMQKEPPSLASLIAGVHFVRRTKIILATITLDLFAVLLGGVTFLLPLIATDMLHVGAVGFGWLCAAMAVGAFIMAMIVAHLPPMKHAGRGMLWAVAGFGAATIMLGISRNYVLSLAMMFLLGAFDNISVLVRHTLVQVLTPDEMRGRVSAVNNMFIGSSNELGGLESGVTAALMGLTGSIIFGGVGTIIVVVMTALIWPEVWAFGSLVDAARSVNPEPPKTPASA